MMCPELAVVAGATGFIGNRLVLELLQRSVTVRIVSSRMHTYSYNSASTDGVQWFGLSDADIERATCDATHFFNFAVAYDRPSIDDQTITTANVDIPLKIISNFKKRKTPVTCVLGDSFFRKFPPQATLQGRYTRSKQDLADKLSVIIENSQVRAALLQIEQVYGPGEAFTKVLPHLTQQMVLNAPRIAMTSGMQKRDFVFVDDVVDAAWTVANSSWDGLVTVECGSGIATPVRQVFEQIHALAHSKSQLGFGDLEGGTGILSSNANTSWLRARGWAPQTSLEEGLTKLVRDVELRTLPQ